VRRVPFSCYARPDSFSADRGRRDPFSCFVRPDSFSAVPRETSPFFIFCAPKHIFVSTEGVGSRFSVLRARTRFQRYRGRRVQFSCFARVEPFSAVTRVTGPVFMFCDPGLVFGGTEGVESRFRRYRGRRVSFSWFARPDSFLTVPRAIGPVFMFYAPRLVFGANEGVGARFHVLRSRTRFRRYRGRWVPFSCFARPYSFSAVLRAMSPVFMFCVPGHVFGANEGDGSRFHVLRARTYFRSYRG
jgi:hypothetical protein